MKLNFAFVINILIALLSLLTFVLPALSPREWALAPLLSQAIPVFIVLNICFVIYWTTKLSWRLSLSLLILIIGYKFISGTYALNFFSKRISNYDIKVLSYNVRVFNTYSHLHVKNPASSGEMIKWVNNDDSDIKCLQEFYHEPTSVYNSLGKIKKKNPYYYLVPVEPHGAGQIFGMIIFSKHPIIGKGRVMARKNSNNQMIFVDVKLKKDTVRVYNIHLQSMNIDEKDIFPSDSEKLNDEYSKRLKSIFLRFIKGSRTRSQQIEALIQHIRSSPYKSIVCGDFNDPPISYSYQSLRKIMDNSFEEKGNGFGFTYNGKLPIRIDNEFADKSIKVNSFQIHKEVDYSDHFPITATYLLK